DLDHDGAREPAVARDELVVRVDLVLDRRFARDAFRPEHLLDLEQHGVAVLEEHRCARSERHAPAFLLLDHARAKPRPDRLVVCDSKHLSAFDRFHQSTPIWIPYASASASTGWRTFT